VTESILDLLKYVLLALIYLFFARVLWAVWSEVRRPTTTPAADITARRTADSTPPRGTASTAPPRKRSKKDAPGGRATRLCVVEPKAHRGASWQIGTEITIGRASTCTVALPDDNFVSNLHARVFDHDGQPMVEDLDSTNGSFHNGAALVGVRLLHRGDRIQIGSTILEAQ
jgi:hypothetical protein